MATVEPSGQRDEVLAELLEGEAHCISFCDPHHVVARRKVATLLPEHFAHQALDPIALMRAANLPRYGDPQPRGLQRGVLGSWRDLARRRVRNLLRIHRRQTRQPSRWAPSLFGAGCHEHEKVTGVVLLSSTLNSQELSTSAQTQPTRKSLRLHRSSRLLTRLLGAAADGQALATLAATRGKDLAAVLGGHASAEAVLAFATGVVRLVSAFHGSISSPLGQPGSTRGAGAERSGLIATGSPACQTGWEMWDPRPPNQLRAATVWSTPPTLTYMIGMVLISARPVLSLDRANPLEKPCCAIAMPQSRSTSAGPGTAATQQKNS